MYIEKHFGKCTYYSSNLQILMQYIYPLGKEKKKCYHRLIFNSYLCGDRESVFKCLARQEHGSANKLLRYTSWSSGADLLTSMRFKLIICQFKKQDGACFGVKGKNGALGQRFCKLLPSHHHIIHYLAVFLSCFLVYQDSTSNWICKLGLQCLPAHRVVLKTTAHAKDWSPLCQLSVSSKSCCLPGWLSFGLFLCSWCFDECITEEKQNYTELSCSDISGS